MMSRARKLHKTNIHSEIKNQKKPIKSIMVVGDSMSDRGVVYTGKRPGLRILQMYGLEKSPQNRFTNGYVWVDHLAAHIANKHITKDLMKNGLDHELKQDIDKDNLSDRTITHHKYRKLRLKPEDIADGIINNDKRIKKSVDRYDLKDPTQIRYQDHEFFRSYCEGGLTSYKYPFYLSALWHAQKRLPTLTRLIVPNLSEKIAQIKKDDFSKDKKPQDKQETLTILWSGVNDFGLVNDAMEPMFKAKVKFAIESLEINIKDLIQSGYHHFILINCPDVSLTPRVQNKEIEAKQSIPIKSAAELYNQELFILRKKLKKQYGNCSFEIFNIASLLYKCYANPEAYHLEKSKLKQDYVTSSEYKKFDKIGDAQPAPGYLFWDQVHPTTHVHSIIARKIEKIIRSKYDLRIPKSLPKHSPVAELKFLELKDFFFKKKPKDNKESISKSVNASGLKL